MTADTAPLLALARECGAIPMCHYDFTFSGQLEMSTDSLARLAERIRQDERERAARICEEMGKDACGPDGEPNCVWSAAYKHVADEIAAAIRSSGTSEATNSTGE
jgi:hypothetical protein